MLDSIFLFRMKSPALIIRNRYVIYVLQQWFAMFIFLYPYQISMLYWVKQLIPTASSITVPFLSFVCFVLGSTHFFGNGSLSGASIGQSNQRCMDDIWLSLHMANRFISYHNIRSSACNRSGEKILKIFETPSTKIQSTTNMAQIVLFINSLATGRFEWNFR